jgi:hypothetical protein
VSNSDLEIDAALKRLCGAVEQERSVKYCRALWSRFVRLRDGERCLSCHRTNGLAAHHIVRKSFLAEAHLQPGNGITLCRSCHKDPHRAFNRRPDLDLPMDAEGGENIEMLAGFFSLLLSDARERECVRDDFYFLSDRVLETFKRAQGFDSDTPFPGNRLEQATLIWRQTPRNTRNAILAANGISVPKEFIQLGRITFFTSSRRNPE